MIIRDTITADRTYYVRTDGSDNNNNGLTNNSSGAFLTIQHAVDVVCNTLDNMGYNVTIQVADGAYNAKVLLKPYIGSGLVTLQGNTATPANVTVTVGDVAILSTGGAQAWNISGIKLSGTYGLQTQSSFVNFSAMEFGTCTYYQIDATGSSVIQAGGNYTISGGAGSHIYCAGSSSVHVLSKTVTLVGTPAFLQFVLTERSALVWIAGNTFSGSATGARYSALKNAIIDTNGAGANYLPGNAAGMTATQGQYL